MERLTDGRIAIDKDKNEKETRDRDGKETFSPFLFHENEYVTASLDLVVFQSPSLSASL